MTKYDKLSLYIDNYFQTSYEKKLYKRNEKDYFLNLNRYTILFCRNFQYKIKEYQI